MDGTFRIAAYEGYFPGILVQPVEGGRGHVVEVHLFVQRVGQHRADGNICGHDQEPFVKIRD